MTDEYDARDGPAEYCVFCSERVPAEGAEVEVTTAEQYMEVNFGDAVPVRRAGLCFEHARRLRERTESTEEVAFQ